jgi:peptide/nickel transport system substrate-binding protein
MDARRRLCDRLARQPPASGFRGRPGREDLGIGARLPTGAGAPRPYLDGIEYTIIPNRSTAILAFVAGKFDLTFPYEVTVPLLKDVRNQAPQAVCDLVSSNASTNLLVNREAPPFDNPDLRRALALALDRKSFIDILAEGQGDIGGAMLPPPAGVWGMPADFLATVPGYGPDVAKNRAAAREIMTRLGYGPDKRLTIKVAARNIPAYRDPAVILIDQLKEIWIDGELEPVETANWFPKLARKDYQIGLNNTGSGVDDPDQQFFENYGCGSERNYTGYCNTELEKLFVEQSTMADRESAGASSGKSTRNCRRTERALSSTTLARQPACSRSSKG